MAFDMSLEVEAARHEVVRAKRAASHVVGGPGGTAEPRSVAAPVHHRPLFPQVTRRGPRRGGVTPPVL